MSIIHRGRKIAGGGDGGSSVVVNMDNITITNNTNNEIQTVAKINQNNASGAEPYLYDWCGTLSEYTTQDIAITHPEWICFITDDNSGGGGGGSGDVVWVNYGITEFTDIKDAYNHNKIVFVQYNNRVLRLSYYITGTPEYLYFTCAENNQNVRFIGVDSNNNWTTGTQTNQSEITGGASSITNANLTADKALISDGGGKVAVSQTTSTEINYLSGVTSSIQTQLNNKVTIGHEVIEFQEPTTANNNIWYRKYADNWVEQGGFGALNGTITLPVTMASVAYSITVTPIGTGANQDVHANKISTTQIEIGNGGNWDMDWEVKGIMATN